MAPKLTSPIFEYEIPIGLGPGASYTKNLEMVAETTGDYAPFNTLIVDNFSARTLKITYGAGHYIMLRGNSLAEIDQSGIRSFTVTNTDIANATDQIIMVYVQKRVTAELALESLARKIPLDDLMRGS